jgi:hypothetical protein
VAGRRHKRLQIDIARATRGFSLGSGIAAYLSANRELTGQLLVTPFDSIEEIARKRYRGVPVRWLIKNPYRSIDHLNGKPVPTVMYNFSRWVIKPQKRWLFSKKYTPKWMTILCAANWLRLMRVLWMRSIRPLLYMLY